MKRFCTMLLAATALGLPAKAQQPSAGQNPTVYNGDAFKVPNAPANYDFDKRPGDGPPADKPASHFVPGTSDLWRYNLQFGTPSGFTNLSPQAPSAPATGFTTPSQRITPLNKDFYGLTLSTPIR